MTGDGQAKIRQPTFRAVHRALADPLRIRLLEYLALQPRSAKELADRVGMRPDRLYHHLNRLEEASLIRVAEYRRLPGGKAERVYAAVEVEPPGHDADTADIIRFFDAIIEVMRADMNSALLARDAGEQREVALTRTALRLSAQERAALITGIERLIDEAAKRDNPAGTWTRISWSFIDAQDRLRPTGAQEPGAPSASPGQ